MEIRFELDLSKPEVEKLASTLGCKDNEVHFQFPLHCMAAAREYLGFYATGATPMPSRATLEYRFVLMVREVFDDRIPAEDTMARYFNITSAQSSTIMKNAISRYRHELQQALRKSIGHILMKRDEEQDDFYTVWIEAKCLADAINQILQERDKSLPAVLKKRGGTCAYLLRKSSFEALEDFCTEPG